MIIAKHDSNGVKPLLQTGELGYDNYPAGGDEGRVYVGTGTSNIAQAKKSEVTAVDSKVDTHVARVDNPHGVTKAQVGLGNADNTADVDKKVLSATKLTTPRNITISGEVAGSVSFDGSADINISATIQPNSVALGTDTTGDYVSSVADKTGVVTLVKADVGLENVDNTSDINKPISTATQTALNTKVDTTTNQTIAGVKTFSSSPIVPTPTINFQPVPLRSTNITVNVGAGQTYTTINQALEYLSGFYPMYKKSGITATINLKAGFVMAEQVLVSGIDLGWITIVGEDAETIITHTALTTSFSGDYPAFGVDKGGTSPVIGQLFRFNVEKAGEGKHGLMTHGAGSSANVSFGKGFIGAGTYGIYAYSSTVNANSANCSGAGYNGIYATRGSTINATNANCSSAGTYGIVADRCSTVNAESANCSGAGYNGIYATRGSTVNANNALVKDQTSEGARIHVSTGSTISAHGIDTTGGTSPVFNQTKNTLTSAGIIYQ